MQGQPRVACAPLDAQKGQASQKHELGAHGGGSNNLNNVSGHSDDGATTMRSGSRLSGQISAEAASSRRKKLRRRRQRQQIGADEQFNASRARQPKQRQKQDDDDDDAYSCM